MPTKADVIPIKDLAKTVEAAVQEAARKHRVGLQGGNVLRPGTLIGRILREDIALEQAQAFATTVARTAGRGAEPGLVFTKGGILAGYWPVDQFRQFGL